ncbi:MAG: DsbA family protein [Rhodospirillales bacterium]|nr:thioredoxin domain-containing protein [Rhodospirillales bacterium]MDE2200627.1 DsbA family protein [Rhodospirillales bacterium]MDE2573715.1 DsbA family protein [Rhodospirillales bacterium]
MIAGNPSTAIVPAAVPVAATTAQTSADPRMGERALGHADAPVTVDEWFSLTCPHCAAFSMNTLPEVKKNLIDTGKMRMVFHDFPLDQVALTAAMVARSLPADRYEPFCAALLAAQDRWAYAGGGNVTDELAKFAALAGMARPAFDAAIADQALKAEILKVQDEASKIYQVDSTPTFIINGPAAKNRHESGDRSYDEFAKLIAQAAG